MKPYIKYLTGLAVFTAVFSTGCKKEFFSRPPQAAITLDNFYKTDAQVLSSTNALYSAPWFGWCVKVGWSVTELAGGNGRTYSSDVINFGNFTVTSSNFELNAAWNSLFTVIAQSNALINNLATKVGPTVTPSVVKSALGEAHLMRALAYFHLVRTFGNVPIIENSLDYVSNYQVHTNPVADIYKFMVRDLLFAEANCPKKIRTSPYSANARVSSGSASALLAKVYLYMQDYTNARAEAEKVINSGEFKLYGTDIAGKSYNDLFLTANNNNEESVIQLQWVGGAGYGLGNPQQASFAYSGIITGTGDGYGAIAPTFDLQDLYDPNDKRRKGTIMLPGDSYPEINQAKGGYTLPLDANSQGTHAQVKKYVVGTPADNGGVGAGQSSAVNTYMMRYSDVYLIEAEAVMAGAKSSSDPAALAAINKVRTRAGLGNLTIISRVGFIPNPNYKAGSNQKGQHWPTIYQDDILDERRREFAFEDDFFFDLGRLDGYNTTSHPIATQIISQQDRGTSDGSTPPQRYGNGYVTPTNAAFVLPYPASEVTADPLLNSAPVPYKFKN